MTQVRFRSAKARLRQLRDLGCLPSLDFLKRNVTSIGSFVIAFGGPRARSEHVAFPFYRVVASTPLYVVRLFYVNGPLPQYTRGPDVRSGRSEQ
jgi:hypothetical protein